MMNPLRISAHCYSPFIWCSLNNSRLCPASHLRESSQPDHSRCNDTGHRWHSSHVMPGRGLRPNWARSAHLSPGAASHRALISPDRGQVPHSGEMGSGERLRDFVTPEQITRRSEDVCTWRASELVTRMWVHFAKNCGIFNWLTMLLLLKINFWANN